VRHLGDDGAILRDRHWGPGRSERMSAHLVQKNPRLNPRFLAGRGIASRIVENVVGAGAYSDEARLGGVLGGGHFDGLSAG